MEYNLYKFFGLQRSGNHAVINWLIGLNQENTLFFNMVKPGKDLLDKPSPVSLPEGTRAYVQRVNGKRVLQPEHLDWFNEKGGNLLLGYENYPLGQFSNNLLNKPVIDRFGKPVNEVNILVLRNPFNMLPSAEKMLRRDLLGKDGKDEKWLYNALNRRLQMWRTYAFLHLNPETYARGNFVSIIFDKWVEDVGYRDEIAIKLGYQNHDLFIDFVSDAGKGSSFSGTDLKRRDGVLSRWEHASPGVKKLFCQNLEVIDYAAMIFGTDSIPEEYRNYGL